MSPPKWDLLASPWVMYPVVMWVIPSPWGTLSDSTAPIAPNNGPNALTNPAPPAWNAPLIPPKVWAIPPAIEASSEGTPCAARAPEATTLNGSPNCAASPWYVWVVTAVKAPVTYAVASAATAAPKSPGIFDPTNAYASPIALKFVNPVFT